MGDPAEYSKSLNLTIEDNLLTTNPFPTILGLTFDPKITFANHIKNTKSKAYKTIKTYKSITRPILEYACSTWAPIISSINYNHLQIVQNQIARIATGHTADTNNNIVNHEAKLLPIEPHTTIHSSNLRHEATKPEHPLNHHLHQPQPPRLMKSTIFNNTNKVITLHTHTHTHTHTPTHT